MQFKKRHLIIAAGCMWVIAGLNVFHIGYQVWRIENKTTWVHLAVIAATFLFFTFIFNRSYLRNINRISGIESPRNPLSFFDIKGWILIAFMITLGVTVRRFELLPPSFIAPFYQGLGSSLAIFGVRFLWTGAMMVE